MADVPLLIVGAGPVGLTAALALHRYGQAVRLIDAKAEAQLGTDPRAVALSHGSRLILERLGVWNAITAQAAGTPIRHIHVSQSGGFGQTRIEAADYGIDALGYVTRLGPLVKALVEAALKAGIEIRFDTTHTDAPPSTTDLTAPLTIIAEGRPQENADRKEYGQTAIVTEAWSAAPHAHQAYERFTSEGPLALLPLGAEQAGAHSIVWCMKDEHARAMLQLGDAQFVQALNVATGFARCVWTRVAPRAAYPLVLARAHETTTGREVALGNAAQTLHPVAGQGLNLGLRDAAVLAQCLTRSPLDSALGMYIEQRRLDRNATIKITDSMARVFASAPDGSLSQSLLGAGLGFIDLIAPAKKILAEQMMFGWR